MDAMFFVFNYWVNNFTNASN